MKPLPSIPQSAASPVSALAGVPVVKIDGVAFPKERFVLRINDVANRLDCTAQHVLDLIEEGKLRAVNILGGQGNRGAYRIPVDAWEQYLKENLV